MALQDLRLIVLKYTLEINNVLFLIHLTTLTLLFNLGMQTVR